MNEEQKREFAKALEAVIICDVEGLASWVDLGKLWELLDVKDNRTHWIKRRLAENNGVEGVSYFVRKGGVIPNTVLVSPGGIFPTGNSKGLIETPVLGGPSFMADEYFGTLKMSMMMCMLERSPKGVFCREFFYERSVEYETAKRTGALPVPVILSPKELAWKYYQAACENERLAAVSVKCLAEVETANAITNEALEFVDEQTGFLVEDIHVAGQTRKAGSPDLWCGRLVAKWLEAPERAFFAALRASGLFYDTVTSSKRKVLTPGDYVQKAGYCCIVSEVLHKGTPQEFVTAALRFKKKGWLWIGTYLNKGGLLPLPENVLQKVAAEKKYLNCVSDAEREIRLINLRIELEGATNGRNLNVLGPAGDPVLPASGNVLPVQSQSGSTPSVVDTPAVRN